ncbi:MAG: hypothetical protein NTU44_06340 [Bacteroidetes bacterium]|nr:hypothetical protein [Bacteroidota bacterium]
MKPITQNILAHMFAKAEEKMVENGWKEHEVSLFMNDPVIKLFYGACAEEIGNVHDEIFHMEQQLTKNTVEQMLPEEFQTPSPAHAIFLARPFEKLSEAQVISDFQFNLFKQDKTAKELTFTPAGNFTVYQADVEYVIFQDKVFQYVKGEKILLNKDKTFNVMQDDVLWIGIKGLKNLLPRDLVSLFFTLPVAGNELYAFLNTLKYARCWTASGKPIKSSLGLESDRQDYKETILTRPDYLVYKLFQNARDWYQRHFITLHNLPLPNPSDPSFPAELNHLLPNTQLEKDTDEIFWVKFISPNLLKEAWIQQMFCSINCFPALSLKIEQELFDVENIPVNIFQVSSDDTILAIKGISGKIKTKQEDSHYTMIDPSVRNVIGRDGEAIFRKGSLGRYNAQKLKNLLNYLTEILKEETILLTRDGTKEDLDRLNRLNRTINDFEKGIDLEKEKRNRYSGNIILRPFKDQSKVYIRFWTTPADEGNNIRPLPGEEGDQQCSISFGPEIKTDSLKLITMSTGGKKQRTDEEYVDTLRKLILSRNRIVTAEDIKAFCYEYFSPKKIQVEVKKNFSQGTMPGEGMVRTIDILIHLTQKGNTPNDQLVFYKEDLLQKLEQHSANTLPFRIEIK